MEGRRGVVFQVLDLRAHVFDQKRRREAKTLQNQLGLVTQVTQTGSHVLPVAQGVLQGRVGNGGNDGIRIRVPVAGDIDVLHGNPPYYILQYYCIM